MSKINRFTIEEIEILKKYGDKLNVVELKKLIPNRSSDVISGKLKKLKINFKKIQNRFTEEEDALLLTCNGMNLRQISKFFMDKDVTTIRARAKVLRITIDKPDNFWTDEETFLLKAKANGNSSMDELVHIFNRSSSSIMYKIHKLGLRLGDSTHIPVGRTKKYKKESTIANRYKNKYGIILDKESLLETYDIIQWWKWTYYGTPNGSKMKTLPLEVWENSDSLIAISRYVIKTVMKANTKDEILNIQTSDLRKYNVFFYRRFDVNCNFEYLRILFPELNIKPFELQSVPKGYWQVKENCDNYLKFILENEFKLSSMVNPKEELPNIFTFKNLRQLGYYNIIYVVCFMHHYPSFFKWINFLYPELILSEEDFKQSYGFDGVRLDSREETIVYNFLNKDLGLTIKSTASKKSKYKFYNDMYDESYIPDFVGEYKNKLLIIEYFGLYKENVGDSILLSNYKEKTKRKNTFFKSKTDILYIDLYAVDLINNLEGVREKLASFLLIEEVKKCQMSK